MVLYEKTTFSIGDQITRHYKVQQVILGGISEVYICTQKQMDHPAYPYTVLKTLQPQYRERLPDDVFEREIQTWIDIPNHTNIVPCRGVFAFNHIPFMVLPYIMGSDEFGTSLRDWLKQGSLTLMSAIEYLIQICQGLNAVNQHDQTIVHCDIKPDNILIQFGAVARLTDFGITRILNQTRKTTSSEDIDNLPVNHRTSTEILGTPAYMSPEQWVGDALDVRSDIYSLGCTLFELVTGRWPYEGTTIRRMREQHLEEAIPSFPSTNDLHQLNDIFIKCLAKDKNQRYASVVELIHDLETAFNKVYGGYTSPIRASIIDPPFLTLLSHVPVYLHLKNYEKARITLEQVFDLIDGADKEATALAYDFRGLYYLELHQYENALTDYSTAISISPDVAEFFSDRSKVYLEIVQYEAAILDCVMAINLDVTCLPAHQNQAVAYENLGKIEEALQTYAVMIETFGKAIPYDIYINQGHCLTKLQRYREAIVCYDKAIQLNPQHGDGFYDRGTAYSRIGNYEVAIPDFTMAITLNSEYKFQAYGNRATCYAQLNQFDAALSDIDLALSRCDRDDTILVTKANIYLRLGKYDEALELYNEAASIAPDNASVFSNRGVLHKDLGNIDAAMCDYEKAIELEPTLVAVHINRVNLIESLNQPEKAVEACNMAISLCPDEMDLYIRRANLSFSLDAIDAAWKDVATVLAKLPGEVEALKLRGHIHFLRSQYHEAIEDLKKVSLIDPTSVSTQLRLAIVYEILGDYENAESHLKVCVHLDVANADAKLNKIRHRLAFNKFPFLNSLEDVDAFILEYPFTLSRVFIDDLSAAVDKLPEELKAGVQSRIDFFSERLQDMEKESTIKALIEAKDAESIKAVVRNNDDLNLTLTDLDFWFEFMSIAMAEYGLTQKDVTIKQRLIVHVLNNLD